MAETGIEIRKPTLTKTAKRHKLKIARGGVKGGLAGAATGGGASVVFGTDLKKSALIGGLSGLALGAGDALMDAQDLEVTVHKAGVQLVDSLEEAFEDVHSELKAAGDYSDEILSALQAIGRAVGHNPGSDDDDEEDKPKKKKGAKKKRKGARATV